MRVILLLTFLSSTAFGADEKKPSGFFPYRAVAPEQEAECLGIMAKMGKAEMDHEDDLVLRQILHARSVRNRSFSTYVRRMGPEFLKRIQGLRGKWIDLGSGEGQAILNFIMGREDVKARADAQVMGIEWFDDPMRRSMIESYQKQVGEDRLQMLEGQPFHEIADEKIGLAKVITDDFSIMSHTKDLVRDMGKALRHLEPKGAFIFTIASKNDYDRLIIVDKEYKQIPLRDYLKTIRGVESVSVEAVPEEEVIRVVMVRGEGPVEFPGGLARTAIKFSAPPIQVFQTQP